MGKFKLIAKKNRWGLTWTGRFVILALLIVLFFIFLKTVYGFLAPNRPVQTDILVVEGFLPDFALQQAMREFNNHPYKYLMITGKPVDKGYNLSRYKTSDLLSKAVLTGMGFDSTKIRTVAISPEVTIDRTYATALAYKEWLKKQGEEINSFNLVSYGCHTRRTGLLFSKAFGNEVKIGLISIDSGDYAPSKWYTSSKGFRDVMEELIAWFYARFFFRA